MKVGHAPQSTYGAKYFEGQLPGLFTGGVELVILLVLELVPVLELLMLEELELLLELPDPELTDQSAGALTGSQPTSEILAWRQI